MKSDARHEMQFSFFLFSPFFPAVSRISGTIPVSGIPLEEYLKIFLCVLEIGTLFPPDHDALILNTNVYTDTVCRGLGIRNDTMT